MSKRVLQTLVALVGPALAEIQFQSGIVACVESGPTDYFDVSDLGPRGKSYELVGEGFSLIRHMSALGDVNGDGFGDFGVQVAEGRFPTNTDRVVVILGAPGLSGLASLADRHPEVLRFDFKDPEFENASVLTITGLGDLNGDGLDDFGIANRKIVEPQEYAGTGVAVVVFGRRDLAGGNLFGRVGKEVPGFRCFSKADPAITITEIAGIGDFSGDGRPDFAIKGHRTEGTDVHGRLYVVPGVASSGEDIWVDELALRLRGLLIEKAFGDIFGRGAVPCGDFNGDGLDDFVAGDRREAVLILGRSDLRGAEIHLGLSSPPPAGAGIVAIGGDFRSGGVEFGEGLQFAGIGDLDEDGYDDVVLGAASLRANFPDQPEEIRHGASFIVHGAPDFPGVLDLRDPEPGIRVKTIVDEEEGLIPNKFGDAVAGPGDFDGDGVVDVVVSAPHASRRGAQRAGLVYVISGASLLADRRIEQPLSGTAHAIVEGRTHDGVLGQGMSAAGDLNGDGTGDLVIAEPFCCGFDHKARFHIIYGRGNRPPPFAVLRLEPEMGPQRGGTRVTIRGSGFTGEAGIFFGGEPSGLVTVLSSTELVAMSPPAPATGAVAVRVVQGEETRTLGTSYEYLRDFPDYDANDFRGHGFRVDGISRKDIGGSAAFVDLDADGIDEAVLASKNAFGTEHREGWLVIAVRGGARTPSVLEGFKRSAELIHIEDSEAGFVSELTVTAIGDVNADGIDDLGIGQLGVGGTIVFGQRGFPSYFDVVGGVSEGRAVRLNSPDLSGRCFFVPVGDLSGDGLADLCLSVARRVGIGDERGELVFVDGQTESPESVDLSDDGILRGRVWGEKEEERFGADTALVGDVDGDGRTELLISSLDEDWVPTAYLLSVDEVLDGAGSIAEHLLRQGGTVISFPERVLRATLTVNVAAAGDVNGDGLPDMLFGDELGGDLNTGITYLVAGRRGFPEHMELWETPQASDPPGLTRFWGQVRQAQSGRVAPAGDWDGDGLDDFLIGEHTVPPEDPGIVSLVFGHKEYPKEVQLSKPGQLALQF
jgi:hypothetical protein